MKRQLVKFVAVIASALFCGQVMAVNLVGVYNQSINNDPTFKAAHAQWLSDRQNIAISRAALLPQLDISAGYGRTYTDSSVASYYNNASTYSLTLTQPIFNFSSWSKLHEAKAAVKASAATFATATQDLMYRVSSAYFSVLQAQDVLRYDRAEKLSIARQLERTKQRYEVGLIAITAVYQAQASYDSVSAQEIQDRNDLSNQKEKLREITGAHYGSFSGISSRLPLLRPNPSNINSWVKVAKRQNYSLLAARYTTLAAQKKIGAQSAARLPSLNAQAKASYLHNSRTSSVVANSTNRAATLGLALDFPVVQGGLVNAETRQAQYDYQQALANWEKADRGVVSETRQAYLGVISLIGKIHADRQAIVSNRSALKATEAGYIVGTQTMVDVLKVQADLYNAQKSYAIDQYSYILQTLALKQASGVLSAQDLVQINSWLKPQHKAQARVVHKVVAKKQISSKKRSIVKRLSHTKNAKTTINRALLKKNSRHYTIQVLATNNSETAMRFINRSKLSRAYCYTVKINGKDWYKIIVGDYATRAAAKRAANALPVLVKKERPWIRKFSAVQREVS